jgi:hypothetical protein
MPGERLPEFSFSFFIGTVIIKILAIYNVGMPYAIPVRCLFMNAMRGFWGRIPGHPGIILSLADARCDHCNHMASANGHLKKPDTIIVVIELAGVADDMAVRLFSDLLAVEGKRDLSLTDMNVRHQPGIKYGDLKAEVAVHARWAAEM